jgi:hypothetical protein
MPRFAKVRHWHRAKFRAEPASAEVERIADIAGDSFPARNSCGRYSGRDQWVNGHAAGTANPSILTQQRHERLKIAALQLTTQPHFAGRKSLL